ncbi:tape measure protein [Azospirillum sp. Marseille-Q6669]
MSITIGSLRATLDLDSGAFIAGIRNAHRELRVFEANTARASRAFAGFNAVIGTLALATVTKGAVEAGEQMIALQRRLELVAASVNETGRETTTAAEQFEWLSKTAMETGTDFDGLSKAWVKLATTAHGAGVSLADLQEGIKGTIGAGAAMGVSADGLNKVFNAMSQVGGKGQLYLEELKQQMGEHLPLAMQITARGLGVTTQELMNLTKKGKVSADQFFEAWAKGAKEFQGFGSLLAANFTGQLQNFKTIWRTEVGGLMVDSGINDALAGMAGQFNASFAQLVREARQNSDGIGDTLIDDAEAVAQAFVGTWNAVAPLVENLGRLTGGVFNEAMASYNSLPDVVKQYGILGAMLLGAKPLQIIAALAAIKEGGSALAGLEALMKGDVAGWYKEANSSGIGRFFTRDNYDRAFGEDFSRLAIDGASVVDGKVTDERRQAVVKERLALEEKQLVQLKKQLDDANKPVGLVAEGSAIPAQIAAQRKALSGEIEAAEERRAMLVGLSQSIATPIPSPTFNPTTGPGTGWSSLSLPDPASTFAGIREGRDKARQARETKPTGIDLGDAGNGSVGAEERFKLLAQMDKELRAAVKQANLLRDSFLKAGDALVMMHHNGAEFAARRADEQKRIAAGLMDERERLFTLSEAELSRKAVQGEVLQLQEQQERVGLDLAHLGNASIQAETDKLFRLQAQVSVTQQLRDAARELALYDDKALQAAHAQLRLDQLRLNTKETQAHAADYFRPEFRTELFANDKASADLELSRLYYEYSLSMEERLQLVRADGINAFTGEFSGFISNVITGQQTLAQGAHSMFSNMTKYMLDFFAEWLAQQLMMRAIMGIANFFSGGATPIIGPGTGYIYHEGGLVGAGGMPSRSVPMSLFSGAPRFHEGGLLRGEVPIIAKQGEAVFTPEQMTNADRLINAAMNGGGTSISVTNNIEVNGGSSGNREADQELAAQIGRQVTDQMRALVTQELRTQMRPGGMLNSI